MHYFQLILILKMANSFCIFFVFLILEFIIIISSSFGDIHLQRFSQESIVTSSSSFVTFWRARSKLECAKECSRHTHCDNWSFDKKDRTCNLQVCIQGDTKKGYIIDFLIDHHLFMIVK